MTSPSFVLTTNLLGWQHASPSTQDAFRRARGANERLLAGLAIEEAFAILVANYVAFEKAVAGANIESMVERALSLGALDRQRLEIDRHLVNVLAAGQMFTDHLRKRVKKGHGRGSREFEVVEAALTRQRERLVGFRATEALRDAVLHNLLPVTSWTIGGHWIDLERADGSLDKLSPGARLEHSVTFAFDPDILALDRKVAPDLILQIKARAEKNGTVSWIPLIREYVEALSLVLNEGRLALEPSEQSATALLDELSKEFRSTLPEGVKQPHYVFIVQREDSGRWIDDVALNLGLNERLEGLRQLHRPLLNLHRRSLKG